MQMLTTNTRLNHWNSFAFFESQCDIKMQFLLIFFPIFVFAAPISELVAANPQDDSSSSSSDPFEAVNQFGTIREVNLELKNGIHVKI